MNDTSIEAKEIFLAALERGEPTARAAYLDGACRGDVALRERVEALLRAHDESQNPLERPAVELGPTELHSPELEQPGTSPTKTTIPRRPPITCWDRSRARRRPTAG